MYIVMMIILTFFAVIGLTNFITAIIDAVFYRDDDVSYMLVIPDPCADDAEVRVRAALSKLRSIYSGRVIAVCDAESDETSRILCSMQRDYANVEIVTKAQLAKMIESGPS